MAGYWNRPEATAQALSGGWLHTGDVARITDDGAIQLLDRRDDIVNHGGENVYCAEVENAVAAHPPSPRSRSSDCPTTRSAATPAAKVIKPALRDQTPWGRPL
jgi:fatty-acyl-CoA synthase